MKKLAFGFALLAIGLGLLGTAPARAAAQISVSPASVDFGNVPINAIATRYVKVTNTGDALLTVSSVSTNAPFSDGVTSSFTVAPGQSRKVALYFAPTAPIHYIDACTIQSDAANSPTLQVPLEGWGVE